MRLDAMYAEESRVGAILKAKQRDLLALHDQMRAEDDRARRDFQKHQHDLEAFHTEADRLDNEHRARLRHFQREKKDLETQLARGRAQDARIQSPSRTQLQRDYAPRDFPPQMARTSIASASAPTAYQSAPRSRRGARLSQRQQSHGSSRSHTPFDSVAPSPPQRVQSLLPVNRDPQTDAPKYQLFSRFGAPQDYRLPRSEYYTTTASAARFDRRERSPCEPYERRDSDQQQLQQDARDWESRPQKTTLFPVYNYLAASPTADRPREQLDNEIALLSAQLEHAKEGCCSCTSAANSTYPSQCKAPDSIWFA